MGGEETRVAGGWCRFEEGGGCVRGMDRESEEGRGWTEKGKMREGGRSVS